MRIAVIPRPEATDEAPHPWLSGIHEVQREVALDFMGHTDFVDSPQALHVGLRDGTYMRTRHWVALSDGADPERPEPADVVGFATLEMPQREDLDKGYVDVELRPGHRRRGIGSALRGQALDALRADGRAVALGQPWTPAPQPGEPTLVPPTGEGAAPAEHPTAQWLRKGGWDLEQCEQPSMLTVDEEALQRAEELRRDALTRAGDYRLVSWQGLTPEEHIDAICLGLNRMSTDTPFADLNLEERHFDAARLTDFEQRSQRAGRDWAYTLALAGDAPAAFTCLRWPKDNPEGVWQEDTLVLKEHRGKRLGMLVKAVNLAHLRQVNPQVQRIHTWNAAENPWMLSINEELGFRPQGVEGVWRLRL